MFIIYKTTNKVNNKFYIGQHKCSTVEFDGYFGSGKTLLKAIKKYGNSCFEREVLSVCHSKFQADIEEKHFIKLYREAFGEENCYNIADGGQGGNLGECQRTQEARTKNSIKHRKENLSEETLNRMRESQRKYYSTHFSSMLGKNHSEAARKKMSEAHKGMKSPFKGKQHTNESKKLLSDRRRGSKQSEQTVEKRRVSQLKHYSIVKEAYIKFKEENATITWNEFQKMYKLQLKQNFATK